MFSNLNATPILSSQAIGGARVGNAYTWDDVAGTLTGPGGDVRLALVHTSAQSSEGGAAYNYQTAEWKAIWDDLRALEALYRPDTQSWPATDRGFDPAAPASSWPALRATTGETLWTRIQALRALLGLDPYDDDGAWPSGDDPPHTEAAYVAARRAAGQRGASLGEPLWVITRRRQWFDPEPEPDSWSYSQHSAISLNVPPTVRAWGWQYPLLGLAQRIVEAPTADYGLRTAYGRRLLIRLSADATYYDDASTRRLLLSLSAGGSGLPWTGTITLERLAATPHADAETAWDQPGDVIATLAAPGTAGGDDTWQPHGSGGLFAAVALEDWPTGTDWWVRVSSDVDLDLSDTPGRAEGHVGDSTPRVGWLGRDESQTQWRGNWPMWRGWA